MDLIVKIEEYFRVNNSLVVMNKMKNYSNNSIPTKVKEILDNLNK